MKERYYKMFLEDILDAIEKIGEYTDNLNFEDFVADNMRTDAVVRNLEIIGEASKSIPYTTRNKHPEIPWKRMIGLRNIVAHEYFGIDFRIIWRIVTKNLPEVKPLIKELLGEN